MYSRFTYNSIVFELSNWLQLGLTQYQKNWPGGVEDGPRRGLLHPEGGPDDGTTTWAHRGHAVTGVCRQVGISEQTFYVWRRKYGGFGLNELRELRQLHVERRPS
jgi:hypothetical protein